jgi:uncharacterized protein YkwD
VDDDHRHDALPSDWPAPAVGVTRRRLLARLAALPAALGLAWLREREPAAARKKGGKGKKDNDKKGKNNKRKNGGGDNGGGGGYNPDGEERKFLDLINDYRKKNGAGALSLNDQLGAAAEYHSSDMARKNYFKHRLANGDSATENIERHGYRNWQAVGENIAAGYETAAQALAGWKKSASHDKNMRSKDFTEIGIGRAFSKSSKYGWYWTTTFGRR